MERPMPQTDSSGTDLLATMVPSLLEGFMVVVADVHGRIALVNAHLARAVGTSAADLQGQPLQALVAEAGNGFQPQDILGFLAHNRCWLGKLLFVRHDGSRFMVQATVLPLRAEEGDAVQHMAVLATSASRRLDFPLLAGNYQDNFFSLLEGLGTAIILHRAGQIIYANEAALRLSGYTLAQLLGLSYEALTHPASRARLSEHIAARVGGRAALSRFESCLETAGGERRWVEQTVGIIQIDGQATLIDTYVDQTDSRRANAAQAHMRQVLAQIIDGSPVPTLVIDARHTVTHWNHACEVVSGAQARDMIGTRLQWKPFYPTQRPIMADLIVSGALELDVEQHYRDKYKRSALIPDAFEAEDFFPHFGESGRWLHFTAAPLRDSQGRLVGAIETLVDVTERRVAEEALRQAQSGLEQLVAERTVQLAQANAQLADDVARRSQVEAQLRQRNDELVHLNSRLSQAHEQLLQSEKLASIGQLAAGVAHEINNPIGFVHSNLGSLQKYVEDLFTLLASYEALPAPPELQALRRQLDVDYLREDIPALLKESLEGTGRVRKIVQDLKDFSRVASNQEWQLANLHDGIDSTLNIVNNEIKYRADVVKQYGPLPPVECLPSQLNQVFMNLLVNAAQAMGEQRGTITIRTGVQDETGWLEFADNGHGISKDHLSRIFDPFFTTKPVGKGTGLGLSLSYGIVQKHRGQISVQSEPGKGTVFRIELPLTQNAADGGTRD
jgi:PAS domain S-box-containing protein